MPTTSNWFLKLGFDVWHVHGISRAWRFEFLDGSYALVTNVDGFDLPEKSGPYSALLLSPADELIEHRELLVNARGLINWFLHAERLTAHRRKLDQSNPLPRSPERGGSN